MHSVVLLALIAALAGCTDSSKLPPEVRGQGAYVAYNCKRCHRIGDEGGDAGPDLTFVGFRKTAEALDVWLKDPKAWQPQTLMPNFRLGDGPRADLAAYLATLKGQAYREKTAPWDHPSLKNDPVKRGEEIFKRAGCIACHGPQGKGGYFNNNVPGGLVPNLLRVKRLYSEEELIQKISLGARSIVKKAPDGPEPLLYMPSWRDVLKKDEIESLAAYLRTFTPPAGTEEDEDW
jgi:mono/diheme cytochrome c family protein